MLSLELFFVFKKPSSFYNEHGSHHDLLAFCNQGASWSFVNPWLLCFLCSDSSVLGMVRFRCFWDSDLDHKTSRYLINTRGFETFCKFSGF